MRPNLRDFIVDVENAVQSATDEVQLLRAVRAAMRVLVSDDTWLPTEFSVPHARHYQQYLLHLDQGKRFSVVSFVWGPGQGTPIHDHTVWGVIGMLRGSEISQSFVRHSGRMELLGASVALEPGDVAVLSPSLGDIHQVRNAFDDRVSVSIHVYGADIGSLPRHVFDFATGEPRQFVSGYATASGDEA